MLQKNLSLSNNPCIKHYHASLIGHNDMKLSRNVLILSLKPSHYQAEMTHQIHWWIYWSHNYSDVLFMSKHIATPDYLNLITVQTHLHTLQLRNLIRDHNTLMTHITTDVSFQDITGEIKMRIRVHNVY